MTAVFAVRYAGRVEVLSDGAFCTAEGNLVAVKPKVHTFGRLPMIAIFRGWAPDSWDLARWIGRVAKSSTIDVETALEGLKTTLSVGKLRNHKHPYEVMLATWSEAAGPRFHYFGSEEPCAAAGLPPYTLKEWPDVIFGLGPNPVNKLTPAQASVLNKQMLGGLAKPGLAIFNAMRAQGGAMAAAQKAQYWIGGALYLSVVGKDGAQTTKIHTWPDIIGQPIEPNRDAN